VQDIAWRICVLVVTLALLLISGAATACDTDSSSRLEASPSPAATNEIIEAGTTPPPATPTLVAIVSTSIANHGFPSSSATSTRVPFPQPPQATPTSIANAGSGIEGVVTIGPNCPVVRADVPCPDKPYEAVIVIKDARNAEVARTRSDQSGKFEVSLPAGRYTVTASSPTAGVLPRPASVTVDVARGSFRFVELQLDSGIR
jgi:hypothetical protein